MPEVSPTGSWVCFFTPVLGRGWYWRELSSFRNKKPLLNEKAGKAKDFRASQSKRGKTCVYGVLLSSKVQGERLEVGAEGT